MLLGKRSGVALIELLANLLKQAALGGSFGTTSNEFGFTKLLTSEIVKVSPII